MDGRRDKLRLARLYFVTDSGAGGRPLDELLARALRGGVDVVQLRDKEVPEEGILEAAGVFRSL